LDKILVTGAAGFIGSKTCELLLEKNTDIIGIDNMNNYYDVSLKEYRLKTLNKYKNFEFYKIDIEDKNSIDMLFKENNFKAVINLAARAGVRYSIENPYIYMSTNAVGTLNLLEAMKKHDTKKIVLASTSSLYAGQKMPFSETLPVNNPISPYAASKKAAEVMCYTYHYLYGFDVSIVRYFTVFGPAGRPDMCIMRFIKWINENTPIELFGDGGQSRDFTYVDDIAEGTIKALKNVGYEIINLGGGRNPISINYVIEKIENILDKKAKINKKPFNKADMKETWADISKAYKLLNWKPEVSFVNGLENTIQWYKSNDEWLKNVDFK
jgi:UDP-glucuronate 4-epimerase